MSNGSINNFSTLNPALTGLNWSGIGLGSKNYTRPSNSDSSGTNNMGLTGLGLLGSGIPTQGENSFNNSNVGLWTNPAGMSTNPSVFSQAPTSSARSSSSAAASALSGLGGLGSSLQNLGTQIDQLVQGMLQALLGGGSGGIGNMAQAQNGGTSSNSNSATTVNQPNATTINQSNAYNNCSPTPPPPPSNYCSDETDTSQQQSTGDPNLDQGMNIAQNYLNNNGESDIANYLSNAYVHKGELQEGAGGLTDGNEVIIDNDETNPNEIASLLVHEGTHLQQNAELGNPDDTIALETEAYENQNEFNQANGLQLVDIDATLNSSLYSNLS